MQVFAEEVEIPVHGREIACNNSNPRFSSPKFKQQFEELVFVLKKLGVNNMHGFTDICSPYKPLQLNLQMFVPWEYYLEKK